MKIAITGTRGIPNQYGGFEQFAMQLSVRLVAAGHSVINYNPRGHSYKYNTYDGVDIIRKWLPEEQLGSGSHYIYDLFCLRDAIRRKADVILECGYASAAPWYRMLRRGDTKVITHMDGMEWQREKWDGFAKKMIRWAEKKAVKYSDALVCDHPVIADYYRKNYSVSPEVIPYGAEIREDWDEKELAETGLGDGVEGNFVGLKPGSYYLLIARLEPENNTRMIIEGFLSSGAEEALVIVGDHSGRHGRLIFKEFGDNRRIRFMGGVFDQKRLDNLVHFSRAFFHGHTVGGTNPSLLEAMAAGACIIANDNPYNRWVLGENGSYFTSAQQVQEILNSGAVQMHPAEIKISNNLERVKSEFQWDSVVAKYEQLFSRLIGSAE